MALGEMGWVSGATKKPHKQQEGEGREKRILALQVDGIALEHVKLFSKCGRQVEIY